MIYLNVARDKHGRLLILDPQPPIGIGYIFRTGRKTKPVDRAIRDFWKEFDAISLKSKYSEMDDWQWEKIGLLVKKHFKKDLMLKAWPCQFWRGNKTWINRFVRGTQKRATVTETKE